MRVIFDTNTLIAHLRSRTPSNTAMGELLEVAFGGGFVLLFVEAVTEELHRTLRERPDLAGHITHANADKLLATMRNMAELVPRLDEPYLPIGRDRNDDFLFAHAIFADADYLVTWDKRLRDLNQIEKLRIVSPPELLHRLRAAGRL